MARFRYASSVLAGVLLFSCGHAPPRVEAAPKVIGTLRLWMPPDPNIPASWVLGGCRYWEPMGVRCEMVARPTDADVQVLVSYEPCLSLARRRVAEVKAGTMAPPIPLRPGCTARLPAVSQVTEAEGTAGLSNGGSITLYPSCIAWSGSGMIVPDTVRSVVAHEIGHEMGIAHVPARCDDDPCVDYRHDAAGGRICGEAIMNSPVALHRITPVDATAFRNRLPGHPPRVR